MSNFGIQIAPTGSANASVLVKRAQLLRIVGNVNAKAFVLSAANLTQGFVVGSVSDVSVSDSVVAFETAAPLGTSSATLTIDGSEILRNQIGLSTAGGQINIGNSAIIQNGQMFVGFVCTYNNNRGFGNGGSAFACTENGF
jgi:hypothetical protein